MESDLGKRYNCLIVAIERDDNPLMTPDNDTVFEPDDLVWVVGDKNRIQALISGSTTL